MTPTPSQSPTCWEGSHLRTARIDTRTGSRQCFRGHCGRLHPFGDETITQDPSSVTCRSCQALLALGVEVALSWGDDRRVRP